MQETLNQIRALKERYYPTSSGAATSSPAASATKSAVAPWPAS